MITTIRVVYTTITLCSCHFYFVVRVFRIYSLSNSEVYNEVLLTVVTVYTLDPQNFFILSLDVSILNISPIPYSSTLSSHYSMFLYEFNVLRFRI